MASPLNSLYDYHTLAAYIYPSNYNTEFVFI